MLWLCTVRNLTYSSLKMPLHRAFCLLNPIFRFFMAASDPAIVSRILSPAAVARAAAALPPNLHSRPNTWSNSLLTSQASHEATSSVRLATSARSDNTTCHLKMPCSRFTAKSAHTGLFCKPIQCSLRKVLGGESRSGLDISPFYIHTRGARSTLTSLGSSVASSPPLLTPRKVRCTPHLKRAAKSCVVVAPPGDRSGPA